MRVAVIQSCYAPWRGYFDFIDSVDCFVIYDDVQYSRGGWRNRNRLKGPVGLRWLTVPVHADFGVRIDEVRIAYSARDWQREHEESIRYSLGPAPYFEDVIELWSQVIEQRDVYLSALNRRLTESICRYLNISTPLVSSSDYLVSGKKTDRLIGLLKKVGATVYVSGPAAKAYLQEESFQQAGINLEYKTYTYPEYPQLWGPFVDGVSILDLIANCGPDSRLYMTSTQPNERVVQ